VRRRGPATHVLIRDEGSRPSARFSTAADAELHHHSPPRRKDVGYRLRGAPVPVYGLEHITGIDGRMLRLRHHRTSAKLPPWNGPKKAIVWRAAEWRILRHRRMLTSEHGPHSRLVRAAQGRRMRTRGKESSRQQTRGPRWGGRGRGIGAARARSRLYYQARRHPPMRAAKHMAAPSHAVL